MRLAMHRTERIGSEVAWSLGAHLAMLATHGLVAVAGARRVVAPQHRVALAEIDAAEVGHLRSADSKSVVPSASLRVASDNNMPVASGLSLRATPKNEGARKTASIARFSQCLHVNG